MNEFYEVRLDDNIAKEQIISLTEEEKFTILTKADIRRKEKSIRVITSNLIIPENETLKDYNENELKSAMAEASGKSAVERMEAENYLRENDENFRTKAAAMEDIVPNLSAYLIAEIVKYKQIVGMEFREDLKKAKELVQKAISIPKFVPNDLLPEAIILGVEKREIEKSKMPDLQQIAQQVINDKSLLREYALVLEEEDREKLLSYIPKDKRREIAAIVDRELAPLLNEKLILEQERHQQLAVAKRASLGLENTLQFEGNVSKSLVRMLSETLKELDREDSVRLLQDLGFKSLISEKDFDQHLKKISFGARIIQELSNIDVSKGSNLTRKFISKKEIPEKIFIFFMQKLMANGFVTAKTEKFIKDKQYLPFLRKLIAEFPNQFNTVIDTLCDQKLSDYSLLNNQEEIFQALKDLDSLTPIIFNRYRRADVEGKKELSKQIRDIKPSFFRNIPIKNILPQEDQEILAEMVFLAYKPVGMSFEQVKNYLSQLEDKTSDLQRYQFPQAGYDFELSNTKFFRIKEGKGINTQQISSFKLLFSSADKEKPEFNDDLKKLFLSLAKARTDFNTPELAKILSLIASDELVTNFLVRYQSLSEENSYNYLTELKEILGVYFKDNYEIVLKIYLVNNPSLAENIKNMLSQPNRQQAIDKLFGSHHEQIDWQKINDDEFLAQMLSKILFNKVLKSFREGMAREINKFEESDKGMAISATKTNLRAYISKNIGSFFAKASAGICTASDINLFNRSDHFHINIVENEQNVRANIQAYIINLNNQKSLLLRGFNPNVDFLDKIDPDAFCHAVFRVAREFQKANALSGIYITGQEGGYHALSNREKIAFKLKKYLKEENIVNFNFNITNDHKIDGIYLV